jgi:hypothetical protein
MEPKAILMPNCRTLGLDFVIDFIFVSSKLKKFSLQNNHKSQITKVMDMDVNGCSFLALLGFLDLYW